MKFFFSLGLAFCASSAFAQWTATDTTPASFPRSLSSGSFGSRWCGTGFPAAGGRHAIVSNGPITQDLTTGNYSSGDALACTDSLTVGTGQGIATNGYIQPILWKADGAAVNLTSPGYIEGTAKGVWGPYVVGGLSNNGVAEQLNAIVWFSSPSSYTLLRTPGFNTSCANGIQQLNVVGYMDNSIDGSTSHAALWKGFGSTPIDLNPLPINVSKAYAIDGPTVVGVSDNHPGLWESSADSFVDLLPAGFVSGAALAVLGNTEVGQVTDSNGSSHAALWRGSTGSFVDLDQFLPTNLAHGQAQSISVANGDVIVSGYAFDTNSGDIRSVQWTRPEYTTQVISLPDFSSSMQTATSINGKYVGITVSNGSSSEALHYNLATGVASIHNILTQANTVYGSYIGGPTLIQGTDDLEIDNGNYYKVYSLGYSCNKITGDGKGGLMFVGQDFDNLGLGGQGTGAVWFNRKSQANQLDGAGMFSILATGGYNGTIVGSAVDGTGSVHGLYWPTYTSQPVDFGAGSRLTCAWNGVQGGQDQNSAAIWSGTSASVVHLVPVGAPVHSHVADIYDGFQVGQWTGAYVWEGAPGTGLDLGHYLPPGFTNSSATGVSAYKGKLVICGYATNANNKQQPVLWFRDAP